MYSGQIRKWQDNVAEDIANHKLNFNENLINAILEVAFQIARLKEIVYDKDVDIDNIVNLPPSPGPKYIPVPEKYFNKDGEIDLSKVTGEEAQEYFVKILGLSLPVGVTKVKAPLGVKKVD